jgi:hypothetical protein
MSIDYEHGEAREGKIYVPLKHRARPAFTTTEEAIAYVREVLAEIGPWPEKVEVVDAASLEGRLSPVRGEPGPAAAKMHAIGAAVRARLSYLEMAVRMPHLALVAGEHAELLWSTRPFRIAGEGEATEEVAPDRLIADLLGEAGQEGITVRELWHSYERAARKGAARVISQFSLMEGLKRLKGAGMAEALTADRWRANGQGSAAAAALPLIVGVSGRGKSAFSPQGGER